MVNFVMELWLGYIQLEWRYGGGGAETLSPVNRPLEPGTQVARLLVPEISPYAHLKHLGVRDNGIGAL